MLTKKDFLLSDEVDINEMDFKERSKIYKEFCDLPVEFFSKMRHLQPQIGCLNACKICSKYASTNTSYWTVRRQRNVISALKRAANNYRQKLPLVSWDRNEHRSGVIFSYLDNDIGNYYYLYDFIKLCYKELGVLTRISTVGYSRYNNVLNEMHKKINSDNIVDYLGGVRLSFTPYEIGWASKNIDKFNRIEYIEDIANFLTIYKPYYKYAGTGNRKFCIEIRYKPLAVIEKVFDTSYKNRRIISVGNYLYISKEFNVDLPISKISDPYKHSIVLDNKPTIFYSFDLKKKFNSEEDLIRFIKTIHDYSVLPTVNIYKMENREGIYYSIDPQLDNNGNKGINIYPKTKSRLKSGYLITERFLLNAILEKTKYKKNNYSWADVDDVIKICKANSKKYFELGKLDKYNYIINEIVPMAEGYILALKKAKYSPNDFFDKNFTIDTGIICNLGRAVSEFNGLVSIENEPLTPTHERNYGLHKSKMTMENIAWRLSCGNNNCLIVEELSLKDTASNNGQIKFNKIINLQECDEKLSMIDLNSKYLVPGQVDKDVIYFYKEYGELGYLASYSCYGFYKNGIYYKTLEHYYQSEKFDDLNIKEKIILASTPKEASTIGRDRNNKIVKNWKEIKKKVMFEGLYLKFSYNFEIRDKLLNTGNKTIVEATTKENYWGCGIDGKGENNFGKLLMEVRQKIRNERNVKLNETN